MEIRYNFTKMTLVEFEMWLQHQRVARNIKTIQQHHTWRPGYPNFTMNHFNLQKNMQNYHVANNGWMDIAQHFTTFPDGTIMTGRSLEQTPVGIFGQNAGAICIENMGNFDQGQDVMSNEQKNTIVKMTALLCSKFNIPATTLGIVYHHWFNLITGERNDGTRNNKTCPGSNFFGGNKVSDCENHFLPLVRQLLNGSVISSEIQQPLKYVIVTINSGLNIRQEPAARSKKVRNREEAKLGAVLRVYEERNGWYKISASQSHWVAGRYTVDAYKATVNVGRLNVRSGPGITYPKLRSLVQGEVVFCTKETHGWCSLGIQDDWVSKRFLTFELKVALPTV